MHILTERDHSIHTFYPDVEFAGNLPEYLRTNLELHYPQLRILDFDESNKGSKYWCSIKTNKYDCFVTLAASQRKFIVALSVNGLDIGILKTAKIKALNKLLDRLIVQEIHILKLKRWHPFAVKISKYASLYDKPPVELVQSAWNDIIRYTMAAKDPQIRGLYPIVSSAHEHSSIGGLLPYTSHVELHFSRFTGYPYNRDYPSILCSSPGSYQISKPDGSKSENLALAEALPKLLSLLPNPPVAAVHGTAEDI